MKELVEKIQRLPLTRSERVIADYFLDHWDSIGFQTSSTVAQEVGVSDTSIIRFVRKLGYSGYAEFRRDLNQRLAQSFSQQQRELSPGRKFDSTRSRLSGANLASEVGRYALDNLEHSLSKLDDVTVSRVVDIILSSQRKYVAGFRGTACCAQFLSSKLVLLLPNVIQLIHADATAVEHLLDITSGDCLILFTFPQYSELCHTLVDLAARRNAKIILVTDRLTSPFSAKADIVLQAQVSGLGFTNSYVAPLLLSEVILLAISSRDDTGATARIRQIDQIMELEKLY